MQTEQQRPGVKRRVSKKICPCPELLPGLPSPGGPAQEGGEWSITSQARAGEDDITSLQSACLVPETLPRTFFFNICEETVEQKPRSPCLCCGEGDITRSRSHSWNMAPPGSNPVIYSNDSTFLGPWPSSCGGRWQWDTGEGHRPSRSVWTPLQVLRRVGTGPGIRHILLLTRIS